MTTAFKPGDFVIYRKPKFSVRPGPHARGIRPTLSGDYYCYYVDKCWTVVAVAPSHTLVVRTRRGKQHTLADNDPALRRASWWQRLLFRHRFPLLTPAQ
jgi:hypothetical protein